MTQPPPRFGIYIHIPFCVAVCPYCDFNVYAGLEASAGAYVDALIREAGWWVAKHGPFPPATSVFVGGGTPTIVPASDIARMLDAVRDTFDVVDAAEITIEANPETLTVPYLKDLRAADINRVSLGVQSFRPNVLKTLGRAHSPEQARAAVAACRDAGFDNVSLDLIFGAPGESVDDWRRSLDAAVALCTEHVSCYSLTIEQGTAFGNAVAHGRMKAPDDDEQAAKYEHACDLLDPILRHYEISNWGRPSMHNLLYWTQSDYVGLGAGAHSHLKGVRSWNVKRPADYTDRAAAGAQAGEEVLDEQTRRDEWVQLALRLVEGLDLAEASRVLGADLTKVAGDLCADGLAGLVGGTLVLTRRGLLLENEVALRLMAAGAPSGA